MCSVCANIHRVVNPSHSLTLSSSPQETCCAYEQLHTGPTAPQLLSPGHHSPTKLLSRGLPSLDISQNWCPMIRDSLCLIYSLGVTFAGFTPVVVCIRASFFLWMNDTALSGQVTFYLSTHQLMSTWAVFVPWLLQRALVKNPSASVFVVPKFRFLLGVCLRVELLVNRVTV